MNLVFYIILLQFLFSTGLKEDIIKDEILGINRQTILEFVLSNNISRSIIIEDFEADTINLLTHGEDDVEPDEWQVSFFTSDSNSTKSLVLFGNTWKDQIIDTTEVYQNTVWQIEMYSALIGNDMASEIQAFGFEDVIGNRMYYSIWGSQNLDSEFFENYYQGFFETNNWTNLVLPIGMDWYNRFQYEPFISKLFYVNDDDWGLSDSIYFDNIKDITMDLPIAPLVEIEIESISQITQNNIDLLTQSYQFIAVISDPDSELSELSFQWDFGDGNIATIQNPEHSFQIQDDHPYTILLIVTDQTGLIGYASESIVLDDGESTLPVKINFVGDIMMGRRYNCTTAPTNDDDCNDGIIPSCSSEYILNYINPYFGLAADISIANLETPIISTPNNPHPTKSIIFYSNPEIMSALEFSGIDAVSLANNHFLDYMVEGLLETQNFLDSSGIAYFGAGVNKEDAMRPIFFNHSGVNIGFIGSSDRDGRENNEQPYLDAGYDKPGFYMNSEQNLVQQIGSMEEVSNLIVLNIHSGSEYSTTPRFLDGEDEDYNPFYTEPTRENIAFRQFAIDQGVDLVINHHPHVLQGLEIYENKLIAHSLGNFIFDQRYPETWPSIILNTEVEDNEFSKYWIKPVYVHNYIPKPATGKLAHKILDYMAYKSRELNTILKVDYENETAEVLTTPINDYTNIYYEIEGDLFGEESFKSNIIDLKRVGSIKNLEFLIETEGEFEFRLGREIIWNGDFEFNPQMDCWDPGINYWRLLPPESEFINDSIYFEGNYALQQIRDSDDENNAVTEISYCVPIQNEYEHTIHAAIKGENASNARINVYYYSDRNCNNNIENESFTDNLNGDFEWTEFEKNLEMNINANFVDLIIRSTPPLNGVSNVYFDDLGIIQWESWSDISGLDSLIYPNDYYFLQVKSNNSDFFKVKINEIIYENSDLVQADFYTSETSVCIEDSVQFFNNSTGIVNWFKWEVEGHEINYEENPIFQFEAIGHFDAKLSVYNYDGDIISQQFEDLINVSACYNGDLNMDEEVNILDIMLTVNLILSEEYFFLADLNVDEEVNVLDILLLITIILEES